MPESTENVNHANSSHHRSIRLFVRPKPQLFFNRFSIARRLAIKPRNKRRYFSTLYRDRIANTVMRVSVRFAGSSSTYYTRDHEYAKRFIRHATSRGRICPTHLLLRVPCHAARPPSRQCRHSRHSRSPKPSRLSWEGRKEEGTEENHIIGGYRYHKLLLGSAPDRWEGSGSRARACAG